MTTRTLVALPPHRQWRAYEVRCCWPRRYHGIHGEGGITVAEVWCARDGVAVEQPGYAPPAPAPTPMTYPMPSAHWRGHWVSLQEARDVARCAVVVLVGLVALGMMVYAIVRLVGG